MTDAGGMRAKPHTSTHAWQAALAAFERWQDAPDPPALLAEIDAQDPALAARVRGLIEADRRADAGDFLAEPARLTPDEPEAPQDLAGQRLGAWTLQSLLGRGGMGEVWRARRSDGAHSGEAAVKLLHSPGRGDAAAARFRREGELLARLRHPHIAQLLDIGEAQLGPWALRYLVIELVDGGERLDTFAAARQLATPARLALMQQVCSAVAHAHAQLIVHRDLKPGNVLVTPEGQVNLLDFGVAKLLDNTEGADELTRLAAAGLTPEYAAPEQLRGEPISVATDVYALGRMLCQLLTGQRHISGNAALDPDLRAIIERATQPRPEDRYSSVAALSEDLRRHLDHEPVSARAGAWRYRAGKFLRRHRVAVASSSLVTLSLLAGLAGTWWQWREAAQETVRTKRVQSLMTELLGAFSPEVANRADVPMTQLLRRGWAEAKSRLAGDPQLLGDVAKPLGLLLNQAGQMDESAEALRLAHARQPLDPDVSLQLAAAERRLGRVDAAQALFNSVSELPHAAAVIAQLNLAELAIEAGDLVGAETRLQQAEHKLPAKPEAQVQQKRCDVRASLALARSLWDEAERWLQAWQASTEPGSYSAAHVELSLGTLALQRGRYAQSARRLRAVVPAFERTIGPRQTHTVYARSWLATALFQTGAHLEALREIERAERDAAQVPEPDVGLAVALVASRLRLRHGAAPQAATELRRLIEQLEGRDPAGAARARGLLGEALLWQGQVPSALAELQTAATWQARHLPANDSDHWPTLAALGLAQAALNQPEAAAQSLAAAHRAVLAATPEGHPDRDRSAALLAAYVGPLATREVAYAQAAQALATALARAKDSAQAIAMPALPTNIRSPTPGLQLLTL